MPLAYVLLYCGGGVGFYKKLPYFGFNPKTYRPWNNPNVSMAEFLRYVLFT